MLAMYIFANQRYVKKLFDDNVCTQTTLLGLGKHTFFGLNDLFCCHEDAWLLVKNICILSQKESLGTATKHWVGREADTNLLESSDRPIHRPANIMWYYDVSCCVRQSGIIYRQASTGSSMLLETLQEMAEQKTNPVWQHFPENCSTSPVFNIC